MTLIRGNRGRCPSCKRSVAVTADGKVARWHRDASYLRECDGFGLQAEPLPPPPPPPSPPEFAAVTNPRVGTCPVCLLPKAPLTEAGRMWLHSPPGETRWCSSVGRKPLEAQS